MTREERLEFCRKCLNRKFDPRKGTICNITGEVADFEGQCKNYQHDQNAEDRVGVHELEDVNVEEMKEEMDQESLAKLKDHQDFNYAIAGGMIAMLIGSIAWAAITIITQYQYAYMAIVMGFLVGYSVQFFGAGIDKKFGYLGAALSLVGSLLGNIFSLLGFYAIDTGIGFFEALTFIPFTAYLPAMAETFSYIDILFYGVALVAGYKMAFRRVTYRDIKRLRSEGYDGRPPYSRLRLPLVVVSILIIGFTGYKISMGITGMETFYYPSGKKMSEGKLVNSKWEGEWVYFYENGDTSCIGNYSDDLQDGLWQWFDESGNLTRISYYKSGLEHGLWMTYFENGHAKDSGFYHEGRLTGTWKYWYENGALSEVTQYQRNQREGLSVSYYENGQVASRGEMSDNQPVGEWAYYYENGQKSHENDYSEDHELRIINAWEQDGQQIVSDGNGVLNTYSEISGKKTKTGQVKDGFMVGTWHEYYDDGRKREEGIYEDNTYRMIHHWDVNGSQDVTDGAGYYTLYSSGGEYILAEGRVEKGFRHGLWKFYHESSGIILYEFIYKNGEQTGPQKIYYKSGALFAEGDMIEGMREGKWQWYYEDGTLSSTVNYLHDMKEGKQTMWDEYGVKVKEEYYEEGELIEERLLHDVGS